MPDIEERFRSLSHVRPPDLWPDIQRKEPRPMREPPPGRRLLAAAVAFAVASAGIALGVRAFRGGEAAPAAAVGNGKIAFVGETGEGASIFVVDPDGSGLTELTHLSGYAWEPAWSPDGTRIAFVHEGSLWVMEADGRAAARLLGDVTGISHPSWSPDGTRIAFESGRDAEDGLGGGRDIYVIDLPTGAVTRLTDDRARDEDPAWSPDGTRIAFVRYLDGPLEGDVDSEDPHIYVMDADGTNVTRLAALDGVEFRPAWSPDGTRIAFEWSGPADDDLDIYGMDADGSNIVRLTDDPLEDREPAWSPDGTQIVFTRTREVENPCRLMVMRADGSGSRTLIDGEAVGACPGFPSWQPVPAVEGSPSASDAVSAEVTERVRLDGVPGPVAAADGAVWVTTYDYKHERAAVARIDATTNEIVATVPIEGLPPSNLAVGAGALWVPAGMEHGGAVLMRVDTDTNEVTGRVEGVTGPVVADATGVWAIQDGPDAHDAAVVRLDPETLTIEVRIPVGNVPFDMVAGAGSIWVVAWDAQARYHEPSDLLRIDALSGELVATVSINGLGPWIAADDAGVWISAWSTIDPNDWNAVFIDASTNAPSGTPGDIYNFRPFAVAQGRVWFISGPHDRGLPKGGVCGLNVETRAVDVCAEPESVVDLTFAHDPATFEPVTRTIWLGAFDEPWVTRIDITAAS